MLASFKKVKQLGINPLAEIIGFASAGVDPKVMGTGPIAATKKLLARLNLDIKSFGLIEEPPPSWEFIPT